jgi:hypothetical protein
VRPLIITYAVLLFAFAISVAASEFASNPGPEPELNKSDVLSLVERGAGQECEWVEVQARSGRVDCVQEFDWNNQSYKVHDYFDIELVNGTVEITQ